MLLDKNYKIDAVTIFNRRDCCGERIIGAKIWVGKQGGEFKECATVTKLIPVSQKFKCKAGVEGNVIKITQGKNYLTLCEVQVWGKESDGDKNDKDKDKDKDKDEKKKEKERKKKERKEKKKKERKEKKKKDKKKKSSV